MNLFEYVLWTDLVAAAAVFMVVFNLLVLVTKLVQVHALVAAGSTAKFSATANVWFASIGALLIYWHLLIPGPI